MRRVISMAMAGGPLTAVVLAALPALGAEPVGKTKVAVLDLRGEGVDQTTANNLTTLIAVQLQELGVFQVVTKDDIVNVLAFEQQRQLLGCEADMACIAEIGGALGVDRFVAGKVGQIGETYLLALSLINVREAGKVESRVTREVAGKEALIPEVKRAVKELTGRVLQELSGFLEVRVSEPGAEVRLDGKLAGIAPGPKVRSPAGPHELRVSKKGYIDWAKEVIVPAAQKTEVVEVQLVPSPEFIAEYEARAGSTRLWAWMTTSAALLTGFGAGTLYGLALYNASENGKAVLAAQDAQARGDTAGFQIASARASETQNAGEFQRNLSIGVGAAAILAAGAALYFWVSGDDPDRFRPRKQ